MAGKRDVIRGNKRKKKGNGQKGVRAGLEGGNYEDRKSKNLLRCVGMGGKG